MLKKSQIIVLDLFRKDIFLSKTIREISLMLKKDYPTVHRAVSELEKKGVLRVRKAGNAKVCELSLSAETTTILSFLDEQEALSKKIPNIDKILAFKEFIEDIIIITGSYAKGKETKQSDIDLVIITKNDVFKKQKLLENLTSLFLPKIHPIVISQKDFLTMLLEKKASFGKEIFKNKMIFRNTSKYYWLLKEAIEHGFRG